MILFLFSKKGKTMFADIAHLKQMLLFNNTDITDGMVKAGSFWVAIQAPVHKNNLPLFSVFLVCLNSELTLLFWTQLRPSTLMLSTSPPTLIWPMPWRPRLRLPRLRRRLRRRMLWRTPTKFPLRNAKSGVQEAGADLNTPSPSCTSIPIPAAPQ